MPGWRSFLVNNQYWKKCWPGIIIVLVVIGVYYPIVFEHKSLLGSHYTASVMGDQPPYNAPSSYHKAINLHQRDPGASSWQDEPWTQKISQLFKSGQPPIWNDSQALGTPLAANMQSAAFYPLRLILFLKPTALMWDIYMLARILLVTTLSYIFFRLIKLEKLSSLVGAIIFGLSGYFMFFVAEAHLNVDIVLPLLLISYELISQKHRRAWLLLTVTIFLMITGGHPESALIGGTFASVFFGYRLIIDRDQWRWKVGQALAGLLLGLAASAFLILPLLEFYSQSFTSHGPGSLIALKTHDPKMIINLFYPYIFGWPSHPWDHQWQAVWGDWSGTESYVGISTLFLAIVSLFTVKSTPRYTPIFLFLLLFGLAKAYGLWLNFNWLTHLPLYNSFGYEKYIQLEVAFSMAALAALGLNYLFTADKKINRLCLILPTLVVTFTLIYLRPVYAQTPPELVKNTFIQLLPALALVITGAVGTLVYWRWIKYGQVVAVIIGILALTEMAILVPKVWPDRIDPYTTPPFVSYLQKQGENRIFGLDYLLYPNTASVYGLQDIRDLDAAYVSRYLRYIKEFINPSAIDRFTGAPQNVDSENLPTRFRNNPFFNLLNVKYVIARQTPVASFTNSNADQYQQVFDQDGVKVYENRQVFPRAFLVGQAISERTDDATVAAMKSTNFNPRLTAIVKTTEPLSLNNPSLLADDRAKIIRSSSTEVVVETSAESPALLVLSDTYYPGWEATIGNQPTPIYQTDLALRGVVVPTGNQTVTFRYRPRSYRNGVILSLLSLLAILATLYWQNAHPQLGKGQNQ